MYRVEDVLCMYVASVITHIHTHPHPRKYLEGYYIVYRSRTIFPRSRCKQREVGLLHVVAAALSKPGATQWGSFVGHDASRGSSCICDAATDK